MSRITTLRLGALGLAASLVACGDDAGSPDGGNRDAAVDATDAAACTPAGPDARFVRAAGNPRLRAGTVRGGLVDTTIADPDVHWDPVAGRWQAYYMAARGPGFQGPLTQTIRALDGDATGQSWTLVDPPVLSANPDLAAWDHKHTETPSVAINPDAPPERRYLLVYSGASGPLPAAGITNYAIGAAFSSDGRTFTRVPAASSPHGQAGLVLTGADVYPQALEALVADPEVVYRAGTYHLWFSSYACATTTSPCDTVTAFGIGHATSADGIHWTLAGASPVPSLLRRPGTLTSGGMQPSVVWDEVHCRWEMWLTSDLPGEHDVQPIDFNNTMGVWHATSTDGDTWSIDYGGGRDLTWDRTAPGEPLGLMTGDDVGAHGDTRLMLYVGFDDQQVPRDFYLPDRTKQGFRPGVMALGVATRP